MVRMKVLLAAASLLPVCAPSSAQAQASRARPQVLGFDFRRFDEFRNLAPSERSRRGIAFIKEEAANPSGEFTAGDGFSIIDHDNILYRLAGILVEQKPDLATLKLEYRRLRPGEVKDALAVAIGLMGDREALPHLTGFFARPSALPNLRVAAAQALGTMPDPAVIPYAASVLANDQATRIAYRHSLETRAPERKVRDYFVRNAALELLKTLDKAGLFIRPEIRSLMETAAVEETLARYQFIDGRITRLPLEPK